MLKSVFWVGFLLHLANTASGTLKLLKILVFIAQKNGKQKVWGRSWKHERFNSDGTWGKMVFNLMGQ